MRTFCTIVALCAALLVASGGLSGDLTGSDDLGYLTVARAQAACAWTPELHQFHGRLATTLPVAALLRAGVPAPLAWRIPGAVALLAIAACLMALLSRRIGPAMALLVTLLVLCDPAVATQSRLLGADLPAAAFALASLCALERWGRRPSAAALAGVLAGLALAAKETPVLGLAALASTLLISKGQGFRKCDRGTASAAGAFAAGVLAVVAAEVAVFACLTGDPLFRLHAIERGHNASVWAPAMDWSAHLAQLAQALLDAWPVWGLAVAGLFRKFGRAVDFRNFRNLLPQPRPAAIWIAGGLLGVALGTSSPSHAVPIPPVPRMLLPFVVVAPLLVPRGVQRSRLATAALVALVGFQVLRCPGPSLDTLDGERALLARIRQQPELPIRTDERTAALLEYLDPTMAGRLRDTASPALLVWNFPRLFFLHDVYGEPLPSGFLAPPATLALVERVGAPQRAVALALGQGAEIRLLSGSVRTAQKRRARAVLCQ